MVGADFAGRGFVRIPNQPNGTVGSLSSLPTHILGVDGGNIRPVAQSTPQAVNDTGSVAGVCATVEVRGTSVTRAFSFTLAGDFLDLGILNFNPAIGHFFGNSDAKGINDLGQIVGWAEDATGMRRAFLFNPNTRQLFDLTQSHSAGLPEGTPDLSEANAISNFGMIVGSATVVDAAGAVVRQAFGTDIATFAALGTLFPDPLQPGLFFGNSSAQAVSRNGGLIVGSSDASQPVNLLGVIFSMPINPLGPHRSEALGASSDKVVGHFWPNPTSQMTSGFAFDFNNGMLDLNTQLATPGWHIDSATGINDFGQICGVKTHSTMGGPLAVLLTPDGGRDDLNGKRRLQGWH